MDNIVKAWTIPGWTQMVTLVGHTASVNALHLSPDESRLATSSSDHTLRLWSFPHGALIKTVATARSTMAGVVVSPQGRFQGWTCNRKGAFRLFDLETEEDVVKLRGAQTRITRVLYSPDGGTLFTAGLGDDVMLWDVSTGEQSGALQGHQTAVTCIAYTLDGTHLISAGYEQTLRMWDVETWQQVGQADIPGRGLHPIALHPDGASFALCAEHKVMRFSLPDLALLEEVVVKPKGVYANAITPDGRWLAVGCADKRMRIYDLAAS